MKCELCGKGKVKFDLIIKDRKVNDIEKANWFFKYICKECAMALKKQLKK